MRDMSLFVVSFLVSLVATLCVVRSSALHSRLTADHDFSGPQKFHDRAVPRIGGFGVVAAICAAGFFATFARSDGMALFWILVVALAPSVLADWAFGLVEAATLGPGPLPEPSAWVAPSLAVVTGLLGGFFQAPVYALALAAMFKQVVAERARTAP